MYNSQDFIEACLASVLDQTFQDLEVLLIDDGSTDSSLDKVERFQNDQRLRVLPKQDNAGVAAARNFGISKARGRYIAFCDSDDIWRSDKLEKQLAHMKATGAAVAHSAVLYTTEADARLVKVKTPVSISDMKTRNWIPNSSGIYDASKIGKVLQTEHSHEDYEMWCDIIRVGGASVGIAEPLVEIARRQNSLSGNKLKSIIWHFRAQKRIFSMRPLEIGARAIKNLSSRLIARMSG